MTPENTPHQASYTSSLTFNVYLKTYNKVNKSFNLKLDGIKAKIWLDGIYQLIVSSLVFPQYNPAYHWYQPAACGLVGDVLPPFLPDQRSWVGRPGKNDFRLNMSLYNTIMHTSVVGVVVESSSAATILVSSTCLIASSRLLTTSVNPWTSIVASVTISSWISSVITSTYTEASGPFNPCGTKHQYHPLLLSVTPCQRSVCKIGMIKDLTHHDIEVWRIVKVWQSFCSLSIQGWWKLPNFWTVCWTAQS